jgi:hypothetical protein
VNNILAKEPAVKPNTAKKRKLTCTTILVICNYLWNLGRKQIGIEMAWRYDKKASLIIVDEPRT